MSGRHTGFSLGHTTNADRLLSHGRPLSWAVSRSVQLGALTTGWHIALWMGRKPSYTSTARHGGTRAAGALALGHLAEAACTAAPVFPPF